MDTCKRIECRKMAKLPFPVVTAKGEILMGFCSKACANEMQAWATKERAIIFAAGVQS